MPENCSANCWYHRFQRAVLLSFDSQGGHAAIIIQHRLSSYYRISNSGKVFWGAVIYFLSLVDNYNIPGTRDFLCSKKNISCTCGRERATCFSGNPLKHTTLEIHHCLAYNGYDWLLSKYANFMYTLRLHKADLKGWFGTREMTPQGKAP